MQTQLSAALMLAVCFLLPASAQRVQERYQSLDKGQVRYQSGNSGVGLPACVHGPAVGQPGDNVSRGNFPGNGNTRQQVQRSGGGSAVGLPPCRTSAYMGEPGDGIRSDLGHGIYGQTANPAVSRGGGTSVGLPPVRTSKYMGQPGDHIRSDLGHHINGSSYQQQSRQQYVQPVQYAPEPKAAHYSDYTH